MRAEEQDKGDDCSAHDVPTAQPEQREPLRRGLARALPDASRQWRRLGPKRPRWLMLRRRRPGPVKREPKFMSGSAHGCNRLSAVDLEPLARHPRLVENGMGAPFESAGIPASLGSEVEMQRNG